MKEARHCDRGDLLLGRRPARAHEPPQDTDAARPNERIRVRALGQGWGWGWSWAQGLSWGVELEPVPLDLAMCTLFFECRACK